MVDLPARPGGMTHELADTWVREQCEALQLGFVHIRDSRTQPDTRGFPDYLICGRSLLLREYKSPGDTLRPAQRAWRLALGRAGADYALWTPADLISGRAYHELLTIAY